MIIYLGLFFLLEKIAASVPIKTSDEDFAHSFHGLKTSWYLGDLPFKTISDPTFTGFNAGTKNIIQLGYKSDPAWYKFTILNPTLEDKNIYFLDTANTASVFEIYKDTGLVGNFTPKDIKTDRKILIELPKSSSSTFYIKKKTPISQRLSWMFFENELSLSAYVLREEYTFYVIISIICMIIFFNIMVLVAYKTRVYAYYFGYLLCFLSYTLWYGNIIYIPIFSEGFGASFAALGGVFTWLFSIDFLNLKKYKIVYKIAAICILLYFFDFLTFFISPSHANLGISRIVSMASVMQVAIPIYIFYKTREFHVFIYFFAFNVLSIFSVISILMSLGYIHYYRYTLTVGLLSENLIMLIAIGEKIWSTERQRVAASENLRKLNIELEDKVRDRTKTISNQVILLKERQDDLSQEKLKIQELFENKNNLVQVLCHDLHNSISVAKHCIELSKTFEYNEKQHKLWETTGRAINIQSEIVSRVRDMEVAFSKKENFKGESVDLYDIIENARFIFHNKLQAKDLSLIVDDIKPGNLLISAEKVTVSNCVFNNIMSNAIKFSQLGKKIFIEADKGRDHIWVSVRDQGVGIPKHIQNQIFLLKANKTRKGTQGEIGTGFGMLVVNNYMKLFSGRVEITSHDIDSNPHNHGTTVKLIFPREL